MAQGSGCLDNGMGFIGGVQQFSLPLVLPSSHPPVPSKFNNGDILRSIPPHKSLCSLRAPSTERPCDPYESRTRSPRRIHTLTVADFS